MGYIVGSGNSREPSPAHMQAYTLKKITYPTGGYTEFDYEPHQYAGGTTVTQASASASSGAISNTVDLLQQTQPFTPVNSGWAKISTFCSNVTSATPYFSRVSVTQQSNGKSLLDYQYSPTVEPLFPATRSQDFMIYVTGGVTYDLQVSSKGASTATQFSGGAFSQASASWENVTNATTSIAGGLRVREIRDYASAVDAPITHVYKYGVGESGLGSLMIPASAFANRVQQLTVKYYLCNGFESCSGPRNIISGSPRYDLTSLNGAVVVYPEVAVYEKDASGPNGPNGKRISRFDVVADTYGPGEQAYGSIGYQVDNSWKGGNEISSQTIRSDGALVKETANVHGIYNPRQLFGTKIGWRIVAEGCMYSFSTDETKISQNFYWFDYPYYSGVKKPFSVREVSYSQINPAESVTTLMNYYYDNFSNDHQQLKRLVTTDSDGNTRQTNYWYPADYDSTQNNISPLIKEHIIGVPIKEETYLNNQFVSGKVTRLNSDGKPIEIHQFESTVPQSVPTHSPVVIVPPNYVKKADISYDATTKRSNQVQLINNSKTSYLWGYNNAYPTAMIVNASISDVAATSFESDGQGSWVYAGPVYSDIAVKTGTNYYKLGGGSMTRSLAAGTYKLEYWAKGTVNLSGGTITAIRTSAADANGWILYEKKMVLSSITTLAISGTTTAFVDEVRVYPLTAQVTTYTYDRLNGMTSSTDPNNVTTYFEYDAFGRLNAAKDQYGNIVKSNDYHYKGN